MTETPHVDILLLRQNHPAWTAEQLKRLPDGIRQTKASHVLEFKRFQSMITTRIAHERIERLKVK